MKTEGTTSSTSNKNNQFLFFYFKRYGLAFFQSLIKNSWCLFLLIILILFKDYFLYLFDKKYITAFQFVPNDSIIIAIFLLVASVLCIFMLYLAKSSRKGTINWDILLTTLSIISFSYIVTTEKYELYGWGLGKFSIPYFIWFIFPLYTYQILVILFQIYKNICSFVKEIKSFNNILSTDSSLDATFFYDIPSEKDSLFREHYALNVLNMIYSTFKRKSDSKKTSFVINLGECYGYGKSTFIKQLKSLIKMYYPNEIISFEFKPWLCLGREALIKEFFQLLIEKSDSSKLSLSTTIIKRYINNILHTHNIHYFDSFFKFDSSLKFEHDRIRDIMYDQERPIVVFVDDVDRLEKDELLALLTLIRNTADFPNIFYIVAADKQYIYQSLQHMDIDKPELYLQKFINLDLLLPANDNLVIEVFRNNLLQLHASQKIHRIYSDRILELPYLPKIFPTIRDVYRFLNAYVFLVNLLNKRKIKVDYCDLFQITVLSILSPQIYKQLRDDNDKILMTTDNIHFLLQSSIKFEYLETIIADYEQRKIVFNILVNLFSKNRQNDVITINFIDSYFIYFSGSFRRKQITQAQTRYILKLEFSLFKEAIKVVISTNKIDSFIYNTPTILYDLIDSTSPMEFLEKLKYVYDCTIENWKDSNMETYQILDERYNLLHRLPYKQIIDILFPNQAKISEMIPMLSNVYLSYDFIFCCYLFYVIENKGRLSDEFYIVQDCMHINDSLKQSYEDYLEYGPYSEDLKAYTLAFKELFGRDKWINCLKNYIVRKDVARNWFGSWIYVVSGKFSWNDKVLKRFDFNSDDLLSIVDYVEKHAKYKNHNKLFFSDVRKIIGKKDEELNSKLYADNEYLRFIKDYHNIKHIIW